MLHLTDGELRSKTTSRLLLAIGVSVLLASCYDNNYGCYGYCGPPTEYSFGVVSADFTDLNGIGLADVVALSTVQPPVAPGGSNLKTYLATGPGSFAAPTFTPAGNNPLYLASADLNGDGYMDVVSASFYDGALAVFINNANSPGSFNPPIYLNSPGASQLAIADVNGDGMLDLVSADFNVSLFLQTSPGSFGAPMALYPGGANWVAAGDLNGDGTTDIALTDPVGVKVLFQTGAGLVPVFGAPVSVFTQTLNPNVAGANIIAIGVLTANGLNDLVITDPGPGTGSPPTVNVLMQDPANHGSFPAALAKAYPIPMQGLPQSILLVDLTGAGALDIVLGGAQWVTVLLHDPANPGQFLPATNYLAQGANEIAVADINGDGKLDIVVSNGVTHPMQGGVITTNPGVLLQSAANPGTFLPIADLP